MLKLISDLLDLRKVRVGTLANRTQDRVGAAMLLMEIRDIMAPLAEQKSQLLIVRHAEERRARLL